MEVASRVTDHFVLQEIINKEQMTFDIQPYKIEGGLGDNMVKTYFTIKNRFVWLYIESAIRESQKKTPIIGIKTNDDFLYGLLYAIHIFYSWNKNKS